MVYFEYLMSFIANIQVECEIGLNMLLIESEKVPVEPSAESPRQVERRTPSADTRGPHRTDHALRGPP